MNIEKSVEEQTPRTGSKTKILDLSESLSLQSLYEEHPYFVDVIEWLQGIRPFSSIRHNYSESEFRDNVLLDVLVRLKREKLVTGVFGQLKALYRDVVVKNLPKDLELRCGVVARQIDILLKRAVENSHELKINIARTKASPEQILDWRRQLIHIFEDIEDWDDPEGVPFSINMVSLQESA